MRVLVAIDSFKGSLDSMEAGMAAAKGIRRAHPNAEVIVRPLADGGEGTTEALVNGLGGEMVSIGVNGPMGETVEAHYGIIGKDTAVIEMAQASGITLVDNGDLDPWKANTIGTGQMILDALERGVRKFIIGIGGSATTEGGIGMLTSLGVEFFSEDGSKLYPEFSSLGKIASISIENMPEVLRDCSFSIACDVTNPLCGERGSVAVFGPQKGVKPEEVEAMDKAMLNYAKKTAGTMGVDNSLVPGAGAAGGLGFAFISYLPNSELRSGLRIISDAVGLERDLQGVDVVLTGEGRLDLQTAMGKVPVGIAKLAKENGVGKVIAVAGSVTDDAGEVNEEGIDAFFPILRSVSTLNEAMDKANALRNMELTVEQIFRLL